VQWFANGAWGERRSQQWNGSLAAVFVPISTAHGFTYHEHLDSVGLIHMNGRVKSGVRVEFLIWKNFTLTPVFQKVM